MNNIYSEFEDKVVRSEFNTVMPVSDLNFNTPNNYTVFKLDHGDSFYNGRIQYHITGKLVKSDGSAYAANSGVKLVNNFPAFLFRRIELKKHNFLIDYVDHVGITSTVKSLVSYPNSSAENLYSSGFLSRFDGGGNFEALGTLGHLGLGFFDHLQYPMFKGGFEITFIRAEDNDAILRWTPSGGTEAAAGKVVIESFVLRVPLVEYAPTSKIQLIDKLVSLSGQDGLVYNYLQWQCIEKNGVVGTNFNFDITNAYRNVFNPKFIIIGLQKARSNDQKKNPSGFDSENIKNVSVKINKDVYPQELINLDITNGKHRVLYDMYQNFRRVTTGQENSYLNEANFIEKYPLMVIDTSLHPVNIDRSKNDIMVQLDFVNALAAESNIAAYVVVVSQTFFSYDITRNLIKMQ